jgi:hypothetical protein
MHYFFNCKSNIFLVIYGNFYIIIIHSLIFEQQELIKNAQYLGQSFSTFTNMGKGVNEYNQEELDLFDELAVCANRFPSDRNISRVFYDSIEKNFFEIINQYRYYVFFCP